MLKKILFRLQSDIFSRFYFNSNFDYRNTILLSSLGRSGSTIVSDIINYKNDYRIIFEPFKHDSVKVAAPFLYPCYIKHDENNADLLDRLNMIITGKIRSSWSDKDNKKIIAHKRLIKDIRTNMMLGWIREVYPELKIILLIRNPFSTVESWMRSSWPTDVPKKRILKQYENLKVKLPYGVLEKYHEENDTVKNHIYNWCINYYIPLSEAIRNNYHITFYENYLINPRKEIIDLFNYLGQPFDEKVFQILNRFSRTTSMNSPLRKGEDMITNWKKKFSNEIIEQALEVLRLFEMERLYDFDITGSPRVKF